LVSNNQALYADNMLDYTEEGPAQDFSFSAQGVQDEYQAVLRSYNSDRAIEPNIALGFIEKVLPISFSGNLKLSSKVHIDLVDATVKRLKIPTVKSFLATTGSKEFRNAVWEFSNEGSDVATYIVYETWRAKKIKITSENNQDISPSIKVGEVSSLVSSIDAKFKITRTSGSTLEIDGDRYYVFAVRTAQLVRGSSKPAVSLKVTNFTKPAGWGIMGAGGDEKYSIAPLGNFETPLTLKIKG